MKAPPPYEYVQTSSSSASALFTFRGKPTIFGQPDCQDTGTCINRGVVQYDPYEDQWVSMDDLEYARQYHQVVEVPQSFCQLGSAPPATTPVTAFPTDPTMETTTEEPWTTTESNIGADRLG